jgi:hypothetical protein
MAENAEVCLACGAKNKKPFYKKWWFIVFAVLVLFSFIRSIGRGSDTPESKDVTKGETLNVEQQVQPVLAEPTQIPGQPTTAVHVVAVEPEEKPEGVQTSEELIGGMRPEFKQAMDDYETFMNSYMDFMKEIQANPTSSELLSKSAEVKNNYDENVKSMEKIGDSNLNYKELAYYLEVTTRIQQELLEITNSFGG